MKSGFFPSQATDAPATRMDQDFLTSLLFMVASGRAQNAALSLSGGTFIGFFAQAFGEASAAELSKMGDDASRGKLNIAKFASFLVENGANPDAKGGGKERDLTPLMDAIKRCDLTSARALEPLSDPGVTDRKGKTALIHAVDTGQIDFLELGLKRGDPTKTTFAGSTPLMIAARNAFLAGFERLLPLSDAKAWNAKGETALMMAAAIGNKALVQALLPLSDIDAETFENSRKTALMFACATANPSCVDILARESDWTRPSSKINGRRALEVAASRFDAHQWACVDCFANLAEPSQLREIAEKAPKDALPATRAMLEREELKISVEKAAENSRIGGANPAGAKKDARRI